MKSLNDHKHFQRIWFCLALVGGDTCEMTKFTITNFTHCFNKSTTIKQLALKIDLNNQKSLVSNKKQCTHLFYWSSKAASTIQILTYNIPTLPITISRRKKIFEHHEEKRYLNIHVLSQRDKNKREKSNKYDRSWVILQEEK